MTCGNQLTGNEVPSGISSPGPNIPEQNPTSKWSSLLQPDEKVLYECTNAKIWAKESYGSIANRSMANAQNSWRAADRANMRNTPSMGSHPYVGQNPRSKPIPGPTLPNIQEDVLLITDKRMFLVGKRGITNEFILDPMTMTKKLESIVKGNIEAMAAARESKTNVKGFFASKKISSLDVSKFGGIGGYPIMNWAEQKGRVLGGQELELDIDVLDLGKGVDGFPGDFYKSYERVYKRGKRSWGMKFNEQANVPAIVSVLQAGARAIQPVTARYR